MSVRSLVFNVWVAACLAVSAPTAVDAQEAQPSMRMPMPGGWQFMQDGVVYAEFDHQGGPRGGDQFVAPNWWMGMATRGTSRGRLTFKAMFSLDAATVGKGGYRELFQAGETLHGRPLIDRQHPHDFFMQLAAVWRMPLTATTALTIAGGPVGEPALGPVAFMHRASGIDNPTAPLSHHTFDSTHIAFGVVTAAVDHGRWSAEGSVFNGREPDENRWDFDFHPLDSISGRIWYRPNPEWAIQASSGRLVNPEILEPGIVVRSTVSGSWTRATGGGLLAASGGVGRNDTSHGARHAAFVEAARQTMTTTWYGRLEAVQAETAVLQSDAIVGGPVAGTTNVVVALTLGGVRNVLRWRGVDLGLGADVTAYEVPGPLQPQYSTHPVSVHVFFRLRPPAGSMGRMWNTWMSQSPSGGM